MTVLALFLHVKTFSRVSRKCSIIQNPAVHTKHPIGKRNGRNVYYLDLISKNIRVTSCCMNSLGQSVEAITFNKFEKNIVSFK